MAYRGREEIEAEFYDGSLENAFVLSVHANVQHGLPLSGGLTGTPQRGGFWPRTQIGRIGRSHN